MKMFRLPCRAIRKGSPAASQGLADRAMPPGGGHQQEEAAAAGPQQLTAGGARCAGRLVPLVDRLGADPEAERPLQLPAGVQQRREMVEVAVTGQRLGRISSARSRIWRSTSMRSAGPFDCCSRISLASRV